MLGLVRRIFAGAIIKPVRLLALRIPTDTVWLPVESDYQGYVAATHALMVWDSMARRGTLSLDRPWLLVVNPGHEYDYACRMGSSIEDLWYQVPGPCEVNEGGWIAAVGPGARPVISATHPEGEATAVLFGTAVTEDGAVGFATSELDLRRKDKNGEIFPRVGPAHQAKRVHTNLDLSLWLATLADIETRWTN